MANRIEWIDSYKGIVILMVVFAHILSFTDFRHLGYEHFLMHPYRTLMMPAFFFISGYLLNNKRTDFPIFFTHRFRQIIVPYFIFFLFHYIFWIFITRDTYPSDFTLIDPLIGIMEGKAERVTAMLFTMITAMPMWFVTTLFISEIYFFVLKKIFKNDLKIFLSLVILSLLGFFSSYFLNKVDIRPWWNIDVAITGTVFYGLGYLFKTNNIIHRFEIKNNLLKFILMILLFVITFTLSMNNYTSIAVGKYGNPVLFYMGAFSGILALIFFVQYKIIGENRFLEYFGRNSYLTLSFHLIALYLTNYILSNIVNIPSDIYTHSLLWALIYIVLFFLIMGLIIEIFNSFLPEILGRKVIKKFK